jgi:hypothetical protein
MKQSIVRLSRITAAAIACSLALEGCRDDRNVVSTTAATTQRSITPRVIVTPDGAGGAVLTVALDVQGDVGKIGSFTGRLKFDAAALAYDSEVTLSDGTTRAANPGVGEVRVAGASMTGIDLTQLAAFRFRVVNAAATSVPQFDVEELHELPGTNLSAIVRRPGTSLTPR